MLSSILIILHHFTSFCVQTFFLLQSNHRKFQTPFLSVIFLFHFLYILFTISVPMVPRLLLMISTTLLHFVHCLVNSFGVWLWCVQQQQQKITVYNYFFFGKHNMFKYRNVNILYIILVSS